MDVVDVLCVSAALASTAEAVHWGLLSTSEIRSNIAANAISAHVS